jgi:hypothetical protein
VNSIRLTNVSGRVISNYPLQFGRPFIDGAIAVAPQVLLDGSPLATQADVKNRHADGSVEFAVVAVAIPSLPVGAPSAFAADLGVEGYPFYLLGGMATLDDAGAPGAVQAWSWMEANVENPAAAGLATAPKWAIVSGTDGNTLPAIPTATPPG